MKEVEYRTESESLVGESNPRMIYVDRPYHDFVIPDGESQIKVEVLKNQNKYYRVGKRADGRTKRTVFEFHVRKGLWIKGKGSDYAIGIFPDILYYGCSEKIKTYVECSITAELKAKSFKQLTCLRNTGVRIQRSPRFMEKIGIVKSLPVSDVSSLTDLIIEAQEIGWWNHNNWSESQ